MDVKHHDMLSARASNCLGVVLAVLASSTLPVLDYILLFGVALAARRQLPEFTMLPTWCAVGKWIDYRKDPAHPAWDYAARKRGHEVEQDRQAAVAASHGHYSPYAPRWGDRQPWHWRGRKILGVGRLFEAGLLVEAATAY